MVPLDRPQYALQMITNFLRATGNYSQLVDVNTSPVPLLDRFAAINNCLGPNFATPVPPSMTTIATTTSRGEDNPRLSM